MANESNKFKWKAGYCPLCNHVITTFTDQFWIKCPACRHHLSLNEKVTVFAHTRKGGSENDRTDLKKSE